MAEARVDPNKLQPTPLDRLRQMNQEVVPLPGWSEEPFYARIRKISLYDMIQGGKIPNELLEIASEFALPRQGHNPMAKLDEAGKLDGAEGVKRFQEFLDHVARASLLEPTYDQVIEHAGCLTQEQKQALLLYSVAGVRALHNFRSEPGPDRADGGHGEGVGSQAE